MIKHDTLFFLEKEDELPLTQLIEHFIVKDDLASLKKLEGVRQGFVSKISFQQGSFELSEQMREYLLSSHSLQQGVIVDFFIALRDFDSIEYLVKNQGYSLKGIFLDVKSLNDDDILHLVDLGLSVKNILGVAVIRENTYLLEQLFIRKSNLIDLYNNIRFSVPYDAKINDDAVETLKSRGLNRDVLSIINPKKYSAQPDKLIEHYQSDAAKEFTESFSSNKWDMNQSYEFLKDRSDVLRILGFYIRKKINNNTYEDKTQEKEKILKLAEMLNIKIPVILFANEDGAWSPMILPAISRSALIVKVATIDNIAALPSQYVVSGVVLPGADDSFKDLEKPFDLGAVDDSKALSVEVLYRDLIDYAKKNFIPLIGTCAGAQQIGLKSGSMINDQEEYDDENYHALITDLVPGTYSHYLAM